MLTASSLMLGGCVASLAAGAVGAAVRAANSGGPPPGDLRGAAVAACTERAARLGRVQIIDAEQRSPGRATVWGTIEDSPPRRSFECSSNGRGVSGFTVRTIRVP